MNAIDRIAFDTLGQWAGHSVHFDSFVRMWISEEIGLKGDLAMAVVWWAWFRSDGSTNRRASVLSAVLATLVAVVLGRVLGHALPFRARPYTDPTLLLHLPSGPALVGFRKWSSFPSDHALVWGAIAAGIGAVSVVAGLFLAAVGIFLVCLPRVYVGLHFATDIIAGLLVGALIGWMLASPAVSRRLAAPFLRWEQRSPGLFYAGAFWLTVHLAGMFSALREIGGALLFPDH